jgi:limonene-1,2-epoxide hydrolase
MGKNSEIVSAFIAAWSERNVDKIMGFFSDDAVYANVPIEPENRGKEAIRKAIDGFASMASAIEFVVHHQAENPQGTVLNERTDRFKLGDKWIALPVMGAFELRGGKISAWRDYFDLQMWIKQMPQQKA